MEDQERRGEKEEGHPRGHTSYGIRQGHFYKVLHKSILGQEKKSHILGEKKINLGPPNLHILLYSVLQGCLNLGMDHSM